MHIVVCVKHIPDPEAPWAQFKLDEAARTVAPMTGVRWLMSPFDEQALEAALRLRDAGAAARITVLSLGPAAALAVLRHGLAMGADDGILLSDAALDGGDAFATATALAAALRHIGQVDLVLTGRQGADLDAGVTGGTLAELLGWPIVSFAAAVALEGGELRIERVVEEGREDCAVALPAVVTVSNELGTPRSPSLRETMKAARKPVLTWTAGELGLGAGSAGAAAARSRRERLVAYTREGVCEMLDGGTPAERGAALARQLLAAGLA